METTLDPSVLRRRRTIEANSVVTRLGGVLCVSLFLAGWIGMPHALLDAPWVRLAAIGGLAEILFSVVLAVINLRRPNGRHYERFSTLGVVSDTIAIAGLVASLQAAGQTVWPLLSMAILTAALRKQLPGALLAWTVTSGILGVAVLVHGDQAMNPGDLSVAVLSHLLIAILSGTQASAYGRQVHELNAARRQLHHQASHDALTGLPNRARLTAHADALTGRAMAVLLLDLNGFKAVNDTLGHAAGDVVLRAVGARLRAALREGDLAGRIGGDEFVVVLADASPATAAALADRLRALICEPVDLDGQTASVGVSIGAAVRAAGEDADLDALSRAADAAMYREKSARRASAASTS
ncbi:GGDEF domain-containing protein [Actinoplanes sp. LDG1-06]|uniref:GGDEF domain-containing protein n=1 Tax=Paractinoplanes ovalisporus TaxID=2810368 RepID=A0ABS2A940_9ACTN|nr:GGDEF domain-containing protein [Actinoplanes ovalisporus]MBM2616280.1 GGDEF domain-containing protein [Actinoplanes ovalisporus]